MLALQIRCDAAQLCPRSFDVDAGFQPPDDEVAGVIAPLARVRHIGVRAHRDKQRVRPVVAKTAREHTHDTMRPSLDRQRPAHR